MRRLFVSLEFDTFETLARLARRERRTIQDQAALALQRAIADESTEEAVGEAARHAAELTTAHSRGREVMPA
mgnify:CR=1 FL=1